MFKKVFNSSERIPRRQSLGVSEQDTKKVLNGIGFPESSVAGSSKSNSGIRQCIWVLIVLSGIILASCGSNETSLKPNILFILVDDLGKEWVSCYGAEDIVTPEVDALAQSGMLFHNVYSMPQCTPTRVTFLTGQYPFRHGWVNHWDVPRWGGGAHFDETLNPCFPAEIKKAGYRTCIAGKWQIDDFRVEPDAMERCGFDEYCMWTGYESGIPASSKRYQDPYLFTSEGSKTLKGEFGPDVFKDFIIDFIRANKDQPMFIYYPMVLTHGPLVNTPDETAEDNRGKFKAMVRYTDKITGEIMDVLEEEKIRDNTVVVWTTDNGTSGGISGFIDGQEVRGGKGKSSEPGICAPFLVSWPHKIAPGIHTDALVDFTDLGPTFLELAGVKPGKEINIGGKIQPIDGRSFKDLLTGESKDSQRSWILGMGGGNNARLTEKGVENQYVYRDRVIRDKRYKLVVSSQKAAEAFYDLQTDPFEKENIIDQLNPKQKESYSRLMEVIRQFPDRDNDPLYRSNPPQEWDVKITAESQKWKK